MPRFLLWNLDAGRDKEVESRQLGRLLNELALENGVDVLLLVECSLPVDQLLPHFRAGADFYLIPAPKRFRVLARFPPDYMRPIDLPVPQDRMGIWRLTLPLQQEAIISLVHGLDRRNNGPAKRELFLSQVAAQVSWVESQFGHQRTIVAGDFNANPFEPELGSVSGMHAVMSRQLAAETPRTLLGREFGFFYNPMWTLLGDRDLGQPPGTYYFNGNQPHEWYWHMLDQVVLRPSLIPRFPLTSLRIVTETKTRNLSSPKSRPDRSRASDHFPIIFDLDLRSS